MTCNSGGELHLVLGRVDFVRNCLDSIARKGLVETLPLTHGLCSTQGRARNITRQVERFEQQNGRIHEAVTSQLLTLPLGLLSLQSHDMRIMRIVFVTSHTKCAFNLLDTLKVLVLRSASQLD